MPDQLRVTVWNEGRHEKKNAQIAKLYPDGMHAAIAAYLQACGDLDVRTATLDEPDHGLGGDVLPTTGVLIWWGHMAHHEVKDAIVDKVCARVLDGMGLVVLHSGHYSKPFRKLMGTSCSLKWREAGEKERLWVVEPGHPIVQGLGEYIDIPHEEMYGERFDIPEPDALVLISWFAGGEVFRSGCCFRRNKGKIFYFRPGHESYPTYHHQGVLKIIANAVRWAAPVPGPDVFFGNFKPLEKLETA
ncbi:MAG: trehalose utilization protein ThuA [Planctomycetes bacterium]|nr:trehalose utilization protein ThuA [Planctomycetota bacterium]